MFELCDLRVENMKVWYLDYKIIILKCEYWFYDLIYYNWNFLMLYVNYSLVKFNVEKVSYKIISLNF